MYSYVSYGKYGCFLLYNTLSRINGQPAPHLKIERKQRSLGGGGFFCYSNSCKKLEVISKIVSSVVKDILTNTETHTYGIKV
ncbi:hypothetical protein CMV37_04185 [Bacillus cereus]|nr:hypothetical protein CMV37_04185 [Bacillus cereus]